MCCIVELGKNRIEEERERKKEKGLGRKQEEE